jgi:hypothetical protein
MVLRVRLVPDDFDVPEQVEAGGFTLRKLTVRDVVADYAAIMSSVEHLVGIFGHHASWPRGLMIERNLADLGWHETEFSNRTSFCWVVWDPGCASYRGCSYIYPSQKIGVDAEVYLWTTAAEHARGFDGELYAFFQRWIAGRWPFRNPIYPGRSIPWPEYHAMADDARFARP